MYYIISLKRIGRLRNGVTDYLNHDSMHCCEIDTSRFSTNDFRYYYYMPIIFPMDEHRRHCYVYFGSILEGI